MDDPSQHLQKGCERGSFSRHDPEIISSSQASTHLLNEPARYFNLGSVVEFVQIPNIPLFSKVTYFSIRFEMKSQHQTRNEPVFCFQFMAPSVGLNNFCIGLFDNCQEIYVLRLIELYCKDTIKYFLFEHYLGFCCMNRKQNFYSFASLANFV